MRTVTIFKNNSKQAIRIPKDMEFVGVSELEICKEGDTLVLRPVRPSWLSLVDEVVADSDFLIKRVNVLEERRFVWAARHDRAATPPFPVPTILLECYP